MPLQLAVFDYDLTLTTHHMFYALSGGESALHVPPPHARTERGQLARLLELDRQPGYQSQGGFAQIVFGTPDRVNMLRQVLEELRGQGVACVICSKSLVAPLQMCLDRVGLRAYFSAVFANVGEVYGATDYDQIFANAPQRLGQDARYLGNPSNAGWGSKRELVQRLMAERHLGYGDAVFVDDTEAEVRTVESLCTTIHVQAHGIGAKECTLLRQLAYGLRQPAQQPSGALSMSMLQPKEEEPDVEPVCTSTSEYLTEEVDRQQFGQSCGPRRYGDSNVNAQIEDDIVGIYCGPYDEDRSFHCSVQ